MAVQGEERLALLDHPADRNAADVHIERDVIDHLAVQRRAIQIAQTMPTMKPSPPNEKRTVSISLPE